MHTCNANLSLRNVVAARPPPTCTFFMTLQTFYEMTHDWAGWGAGGVGVDCAGGGEGGVSHPGAEADGVECPDGGDAEGDTDDEEDERQPVDLHHVDAVVLHRLVGDRTERQPHLQRKTSIIIKCL